MLFQLGIRERARFGITLGKLAALYKKLKQEGVIEDDAAPEEVAAILLDNSLISLSDEQRTELAKLGAVDWDKLLAFIEKMLPIILQLIAMFG